MGEPKATGNSNSHTGESGAQVEITIESLLPKSASFSLSRCIYKVPKCLRNGYEEAYTPQIISIGPYHSKRSNLKGMNFHKMRYVEYFLKQRTKAELATYVEMAREWEQKVREYYSEDVGFNNTDELVRMILLDSIFLVEFVLRFSEDRLMQRGFTIKKRTGEPHYLDDDELFMQKSYTNDIIRDLMLLENQVPLFLFEGLYKTYKNDDKWTSLLISFCAQYLDPLDLFLRIHREISPDSIDTSNIMHLVDFLHSICIVKKEDDIISLMDCIFGQQFAISRSATELHEAGLKFEPISDQTRNNGIQFTHVNFDNKLGKLQIVPLSVNRHTESIFRNIIAYEHCHRKYNIFRSYVIFMDYLINTPDDVDLLIKSKIIKNTLGESEDVCTLFNNLYKIPMIDKDDFCYARTCSRLNNYSKSWWHRQKARWFRWKVSLKHNYFDSPWSIISFIAAFILLALTTIQTVCSIKSTHW